MSEAPVTNGSRGWLATIRKLLQKSEAEGVSPHEAEALRNKAYELADKFRIDHATLIAEGKEKSDKIVGRTGTVQRPYRQIFILANEIAKFCDCRMVITGKDTYHLIGFETDVERWDLLYTSLLLQGISGVLPAYRHHVTVYGERARRRSTFKRSWWAAFDTALVERFEEIKRRQRPVPQYGKATGTDIVLRDRSLAVAEAVARGYPGLRKGRTAQVNTSGWNQGYASGQRADIGHGNLGNNRKAVRP